MNRIAHLIVIMIEKFAVFEILVREKLLLFVLYLY